MPQINRYDTPAQAQFINTYVPIPFQEMVAAGQMKQDRYDKAAGALDATIGALDEITAIPNSEDELRAKDYSNRLRGIRDKYVTRDLSDPFVQRELSNEINSSINKDDIRHIQQSYQGYLNYNKLLADYASKGVDAPIELMQNFTGYDSSRVGVFTGVPQQQLDVYGDTRKFFEDMEPTYQGPVDVSPGVKGIKHAVTENRILEHASKNIDAYMSLPSVRQYIEVTNRRGLGNGRTREEIALDYVKNHAPEFVRSQVTQTYNDPTYVPGGQTTNPPYNPQTTIREGADKESSQAVKQRVYEKDRAAAEQAAMSPGATQADKNRFQEFKDIEAIYEADKEGKVKSLYETGLESIYKNSVDALMSQEKMSRQEAVDFVASVMANRKGGLLDSNTGAAVFENMVTTLKSTPGKLWEGFRENLTEDQAKDMISRRVVANLPAFTFNAVFNPKSDKFTKSAEKMQSDVDEVVSAWSDVQKSIKSPKTKGEVINNIYNGLNTLENKVKDFNKSQQESVLAEYNSTRTNQETSKMLNNVYAVDGSGRVYYEFRDKEGRVQKSNSALSTFVKDLPTTIKDLTFKVDEEDKKLQKASLEKIQKAVSDNKDIKVVKINDNPDKNGNVRATVAVISKDGVQSTDFEVLLPLNEGQNRDEVFRELSLLGQDELVFNLGYTNPIIEEFTSYPWDSKKEQTIQFGSDPSNYIKINKIGNKYSISAYMPVRGINGVVMADGLNYNETPYRIKDAIYRLTKQKQ